MKNSRVVVGLLAGLALALLTVGCTTYSAQSTMRRARHTYAIVVADNRGQLSPAEFKKVEIGVVQFLIDEGFVGANDRYTGDLMKADVVFRVKVAWQGKAGGFAVTDVLPSYTAGPEPAEIAGTAPPYYDNWYNDPWYGWDSFGGYYGGYDALWGLYPFLPIYGADYFGSRRVARGPARRGDNDRDHDGRPAGGYAQEGPHRWYPRGPVTWDNDRGGRPPSSDWRNRDRDADHRGNGADRSDWHRRPPGPTYQAAGTDPNPQRWRAARSGDRNYRPTGTWNRPAVTGERAAVRTYSSGGGRSFSGGGGGSAPRMSSSAPAPSYSAPASSSASSSSVSSSSPPASNNSSSGTRQSAER